MTTALALVQTGGEPRADSRLLAERLKNGHRHVIRLIDRYAAKFERFGVLRFENAKPSAVGGRPERYALLNEDQSYFLLSLSRNSDHVVTLKADLVAAFADARAGRMKKGMSLFQRRLLLETKDANSKAKASFGSRLLNDRRRELPAIRDERARLDGQMQRRLFAFEMKT